MKITFLNGAASGQVLDSGELQEITLGRENTNVIPLEEEGVSRRHALLKHSPAGWTVCDLGSTNGVKVNGQQIPGEFALSEGDLIEIGVQKLSVSGVNSKAPVISLAPAEPEPESGTPPATEFSSKTDNSFDRDKLMASINSGALFGTGAQEQSSGKKNQTDPFENSSQTVSPKVSAGRRKMSPLLFYTLLVCLTVVMLTACLKLFSPAKKEKKSASRTADAPMSLYYEKVTVSQDNVFRFSVSVENRKAVFCIDDIRSRRHPEPYVYENPVGLDVLHSKLLNSGIWNVKQGASGRSGSGLHRRLGVVIGSRITDISVAGHRIGREFEEIESAIYDFAEGCGMQTVSLSGDQILKMATESFHKAEDLYANRESGGANLRDAISRYRLVVNYLSEFSPPQTIWKKAGKRLAEAEKLLKNKLDELEYRRVTLQNARDFTSLRRVFLEIMELTERDSKEYNIARKRLHILDSHLKKSRGSR